MRNTKMILFLTPILVLGVKPTPNPSVTMLHLVENWFEELKQRVPTGRLALNLRRDPAIGRC